MSVEKYVKYVQMLWFALVSPSPQILRDTRLFVLRVIVYIYDRCSSPSIVVVLKRCLICELLRLVCLVWVVSQVLCSCRRV